MRNLAPLLSLLLSLSSCSGKAVCTAGESVACVGPGGCVGGQVCADDGSKLGACDCTGGGRVDLGGGGPSGTFKFVTNSLTLPASNSYALDIDNDGHKDNALKMLLSPLAGQGVDMQTPVNMAVAKGEGVFLLALATSDLTQSAGAQLTVRPASTPPTPPRYDGKDALQADLAQPPTHLSGAIGTGALSTTLPKDMGPAQADIPTLTLSLPFIAGGPLPLKLWGAHIAGTVSTAGVMSGEIHGAIVQSDIDANIIPAVAALVTQQIHDDTKNGTPGNTAKIIISLFEDTMTAGSPSIDKCKVAARCCAYHPDTCVILPAEVKASPVVGGLLAADVGLHDSSGAWKPQKGNTKDAMSVGIGFTAVKASF